MTFNYKSATRYLVLTLRSSLPYLCLFHCPWTLSPPSLIYFPSLKDSKRSFLQLEHQDYDQTLFVYFDILMTTFPITIDN